MEVSHGPSAQPCAACCRCLRPRHAGPSGPAAGKGGPPGIVARVWRDPRFYALATSMAMIVSVMTVPEVHLGNFAIDDGGHSPEFASQLYLTLGVAGIVGRTAFGLLTLFYDVDLQFLIQAAGVATGVMVTSLSLYHSEEALIMFSIVFGALGTAIYGFVAPLLANFFGLEGLPYALGGTYTLRAVPVLLAAPLAGLARDATGSYSGVWFFCGVLLIASALPIGLLHCTCTRIKREKHVDGSEQLHDEPEEEEEEEAVEPVVAATASGKAKGVAV